MLVNLTGLDHYLERTSFWLPTVIAIVVIALTRLISLFIERKTLPKSKKTTPKWLRPINKYFKNLTKSYFKVKEPIAKSLKRTSKLTRAFVKHLKIKTGVALPLLIVIALIIGASLGYNYSSRISKGITQARHYFLSQSKESPSTTTVVGPAQSNSQFSTYPTWAQDFADYNSRSINQRYWNVDLGSPQNGNSEAEYYTGNSTNLRISNGSLVMEAIKQAEPNGLQYSSSKIDTDGKVSFLYGRIDVTAKIPDGVGTWPAIWFLPANNKYEDLDLSSNPNRYLNGGEIDLVEAVGFNPNIVYSIVHTLQTNQNNPDAIGDFNQITLANNNSQYYTYSILWTPSSISFQANNSTFFTYTKPAGSDYTTWPFDQPFYMIMNLAVGGSWGGEDTAQFPNGIDNSALPASMNIKSIYYYPYLGQTQ